MHATDPVNRIMTQPVLAISADTPVQTMLQLFIDHPIHHLPVVDAQRVIGMLSAADVMKLEFFLPSSTAARTHLLHDRFQVRKIMRAPVVTIAERETIQQAITIMTQHGFHSLPVVDRNELLVGIVTTTDIMHHFLRVDALSTTRNKTSHRTHMEHAITHARIAIATGKDTEGVAAALLHSAQRLEIAQAVVQAAKRYLNTGQDEHMHTVLQKTIEQADRLEQQLGYAVEIGIDAGE